MSRTQTHGSASSFFYIHDICLKLKKGPMVKERKVEIPTLCLWPALDSSAVCREA